MKIRTRSACLIVSLSTAGGIAAQPIDGPGFGVDFDWCDGRLTVDETIRWIDAELAAK